MTSGEFQFAHPWVLLLLTALPALWALTYWRARRLRSGAVTLPTAETAHSLPRTIRVRLLPMLTVARYAAMALVAVALARPQRGLGRVETTTEGIALELVIDRSASMREAIEFDGRATTRFAASQRVVREFLVGNGRDLPGRPHDLVGVVAFAGLPATVCPLVRDPHAVAELVDLMQPAIRGVEQGTAIGDGLALGAARLRRAEEDLKDRARDSEKPADGFTLKSKVMVLLSDGANNVGDTDPMDAAELAAEWGIKVYTIGIWNGSSMDSEQMERSLAAIAERTGGFYRRAVDAASLHDIYAQVDRMEKTSVTSHGFTDMIERFGPLAVAAAALVAVEGLLAATVLRRAP